LPVILYWYERWSFKLREESWLRVFENKLLRTIFRTKQDKVTEMWRKIQNEAIKHPYCLSNIIWVIKSMRWAGQVLGREQLRTGHGGEITEKGSTWKRQT